MVLAPAEEVSVTVPPTLIVDEPLTDAVGAAAFALIVIDPLVPVPEEFVTATTPLDVTGTTAVIVEEFTTVYDVAATPLIVTPVTFVK